MRSRKKKYRFFTLFVQNNFEIKYVLEKKKKFIYSRFIKLEDVRI